MSESVIANDPLTDNQLSQANTTLHGPGRTDPDDFLDVDIVELLDPDPSRLGANPCRHHENALVFVCPEDGLVFPVKSPFLDVIQ